jgi:hypothetical protein
MRWSVLVVCAACHGPAAPPVSAELGNHADTLPGRSSHLAAPWIVVEPEGPRFMVPARWRDRGVQLHLTRAEIEQVRGGGGEFHAEMAEIVDAALPFEDCAFAGGDVAWSEKAVADTQMRVYVTSEPVELVEKRIEDRGSKAVRAIVNEERAAARENRPVDPDRERARWVFTQTAIPGLDPWREDEFKLNISFADGLAGPTWVHFHVRELGRKTVIVVLMSRAPRDDVRVAIKTMKE